MLIDPDEVSIGQVYAWMIRIITPRPIAWVATQSPGGVPNLAPFSYFSGVSSNPAALLFCCANRADGTAKDTLRNLREIPQFVVNVVPAHLGPSMLATSAELEYEVSEFSTAGLDPVASQRVVPPGVKESPIRIECEVLQIVPVGSGIGASHVILGKILLFDVADYVLDASGKIDPEKVDTIGRMGGRGYCHTRDRFDLLPTVNPT